MCFMPRFSANLGFLFPELPFLDRFAAAAAAGFRAVEFANPYSHDAAALAQRLRAHDLACVLLNMPMGDRGRGEMGIACLPDRTDEFRASVARAADAARALGCPSLNCMAGRQPAGADPAALRRTLVGNIRFAARQLARAGLTLNLEPLSTVEFPDIFVRGSAQAVDIIREVAEDNVRLQFDAYHMHIMEGDVPGRLAALLPLIGHVQFADVPGRHEPGTGEVDHRALFSHLDALGYTGWVGAEYRPSRRTEETLAWLPRG
jgi:hydroxypyruvate isomerase